MENYTYNALEDAIKQRITNNVSYLTERKMVHILPTNEQGVLSDRVMPTFPFLMLSLLGMSVIHEDAVSYLDGKAWREQYIWGLYIVAQSYRSVERIIRGDEVQNGAYSIIQDVVSALQGAVILPNITPIEVLNSSLVDHKPTYVIYRIEITFIQERTSDTESCL